MTVNTQEKPISFLNAYEGAKIGGTLGFALGATLACEISAIKGLNILIELGKRTLGNDPTYPLSEEECNQFYNTPTCNNPLVAPLPFTAIIITVCTITGTVAGVIGSVAGRFCKH